LARYKIIILQAVRSRAVPQVTIPTDDHLKLYGKKLPKPAKSIAVAATKERRRYIELRQQEDSGI
jgi:hypothetical protein